MKKQQYPRDKVIQIRLNEKEYDILLEICNKYQLNTSELIRMIIWRMYDM